MEFRQYIQKTYGGIDVLINNASVPHKVDFLCFNRKFLILRLLKGSLIFSHTPGDTSCVFIQTEHYFSVWLLASGVNPGLSPDGFIW